MSWSGHQQQRSVRFDHLYYTCRNLLRAVDSVYHSRHPRNQMSAIRCLRIKVLGGFRVEANGYVVPQTAWRRRKAAALIKLLVLAPGCRLHREQIWEELWPGISPSDAQNNLHRTLHSARRILQPQLRDGATSEFLKFHNGLLVLSPSLPAIVDAEEFEQSAIAARASGSRTAVERAIRCYSGDLFPEDRYEDWATLPRERLHRLYLSLLVDLGRHLRKADQLREAIATLLKVISLEPAHYDATSELLQLFHATGQRGELIETYRQFKRLLWEDFASHPDPELQRLYESLTASLPVTPQAPSRSTNELSRQRSPTLPHPLTAFIGRASALAELTRRIGQSRLTTLIGPGGCGKTRLAIESSARLRPLFPDGVWWVELSKLGDPRLVPETVAHSLGLPIPRDGSALETVRKALRGRTTLIVLDNCEHLIDACANLVNTLLHEVPGCQILTTTRIALNVPGEAIWPVPPMSIPPANQRLSLEELAEYEAVSLYLECAHTADSRFRLTPDNAQAIHDICRRLDGLPLAIELAAARSATFGPDEIARRLDDSLGFLSRGRRSADIRHRTLQGVLDWSYDLLSTEEQTLFRQLAVFANGWTLEAAEAIAGSKDHAALVPNWLSSLIDQSFVTVEGHHLRRRYRLLEPIRQYASMKMKAAGEEQAIRDQHLTWAITLAESVEPSMTNDTHVLDLLEVEHDNIRAALRWAIDSRQVDRGIRLAGTMWRFWFTRGYLSEGRAFLTSLLEDLETLRNAVDGRSRAEALVGAGVIAYTQGDQYHAEQSLHASLTLWRQHSDDRGIAESLSHLATVAQNRGERTRALALIKESLDRYRQLGEHRGIATALHRLGSLSRELGRYRFAYSSFRESQALFQAIGDIKGVAIVFNTLGKTVRDQGDYDRAIALHEASLHSSRQLGDLWGIARAIDLIGASHWYRGEPATAISFQNESLAMSHELGDRWGIAGTLCSLGLTAHSLGNIDQAFRHFAESRALCRTIGDVWVEALTCQGFGLIALSRHDWPEAAKHYQDAILLRRRMGSPWGLAADLEGVAMLAFGSGHPREAAWFWGSAAALRDQFGTPIPRPARAAHAQGTAATRITLGDMLFESEFTLGTSRHQRQAVTRALRLLARVAADVTLDHDDLHRARALTAREHDIARLVAIGLTNRAIGKRLGIAERTVDTHVSHVLRKLQLRSRAELAPTFGKSD